MNRAMLADAARVLVTRVVLRASNLIVLLVLVRSLEVAELGFYGYAMATAVVLAIALDLGQRQAAAYLVGHEPERAPAVVTHLLASALLLAALGIVLCWVALQLGGFRADFGATLMLLAALGTAPMLVLRMGQGVFLGRGDLAGFNRSELLSRGVMLVGVLAAWLAGLLDLGAALILLLVAHLVAAGFLVTRLRGDLAPRTLLEPRLVRRMLRLGAAFAGATLLMVLQGRLGIWLVGARLDAEAVGLYFGVQRLGEALVEIASAVGIVIFSHGVRALDPKASAGDAIRIARVVTALMAVVALLASLLAVPLLALVLGAPFAAEATTFRLVMLGTVASCFAMMVYPSLSAQGLAHYGIAGYGAGCAVALALLLLLLPQAGLPGAGMAFAAATWTTLAVLVAGYRRRFAFPLAQILLPQPEDLRALLALSRELPVKLRRAARPGR
jgi:O-antigen/teichoic acid export membrane protein